MLTGIILSLISVSCFAGYQLSNKENILRLGLHRSTLYLYIIAQMVLSIGLLIGYIQSPQLLINLIASNHWLFMIGLGFEGAVTIILFFWLLDKTRLGLSYTLASTYSIMTVLGAMVFLGEKISHITFIAIITALLASLWLGFAGSVKFNKSTGEIKTESANTILITAILPLFVALGWTVFNFGCKVLVDSYGGFNTAFFTEGAVMLWIILWALMEHKCDFRELSAGKSDILKVSYTAMFFAVGGIAYYLALGVAPLSIVSGILGLAPALVFALSVYYLHEHFSRTELASIFVIIVSIACVSVFH